MNNQRSEISHKNPYWISRFRYLELKNFALQYPDWKLARNSINVLQAHQQNPLHSTDSSPTEKVAIKKLEYERKMDLVESAAYEAEPTIYKWLLEGVTRGYSYPYLSLKLGIPAGKDLYYDRYRKFFWILDKKRG